LGSGTIEDSKAIAYAETKGWLKTAHKNEDHLILAACPICGKDNYHFYLRYAPREKDGLWDCKVCGQNGNLRQLMEFNGDRMENTMSMKDLGQRQPDALPQAETAHYRLMNEANDEAAEEVVLDYLVGERGFSVEAIEHFKLGLTNEYGKKWILIPFYNKGNLIYAKYRTVPPAKKEFRGLSGRECPLFNQEVIVQDMEELILTEGEFDALSCWSNGIKNVVGVPGANMKKALWIKSLDDAAPKKIYLLYDNDKVGQEAAKEMAVRVGIEKCYNVVLPSEFNGTEVKDINEFFKAGGTVEDLQKILASAKPFAVEGIYSVTEVVEEIRNDILERGGVKAKYRGKWDEVNLLTGGYDDGDLVGVIAEGKVGKTTWCMNELDYLVRTYSRAGLMFCQEMQPKRLVSKWISYITDTPDDKLKVENVDAALSNAADMKADLLWGYTKSSKFSEIADTIRQAVRRYGVKFVCFDNLQMLCRSVDHSAQETSIITKQFKSLAMELQIVILLIVQPNRVREGEIVAARNASGSSAIEKDVDTMICLHRNREGKIKQEDFDSSGGYFKGAENFQPQMLVRVDLARYASGGQDTLWMDGARSKIVSFPKDAIAALAALKGEAVSQAVETQVMVEG
jgi:5S rRNA maturation endonuclease (ribonuclease M5)/KaiC/GvpD/RAD55 family RecA-like ATPase